MRKLASRPLAFLAALIVAVFVAMPASAKNEAQITTATRLNVNSSGNQTMLLGGYSYANETFSGSSTQSIKVGSGTLHAVVVGTPAAGSVVKVYDGTSTTDAANDTLIAPLDTSASGSDYIFDATFSSGLILVQSGASSDVTVVTQ
jgi:hypothetical protein